MAAQSTVGWHHAVVQPQPVTHSSKTCPCNSIHLEKIVDRHHLSLAKDFGIRPVVRSGNRHTPPQPWTIPFAACTCQGSASANADITVPRGASDVTLCLDVEAAPLCAGEALVMKHRTSTDDGAREWEDLWSSLPILARVVELEETKDGVGSHVVCLQRLVSSESSKIAEAMDRLWQQLEEEGTPRFRLPRISTHRLSKSKHTQEWQMEWPNVRRMASNVTGCTPPRHMGLALLSPTAGLVPIRQLNVFRGDENNIEAVMTSPVPSGTVLLVATGAFYHTRKDVSYPLASEAVQDAASLVAAVEEALCATTTPQTLTIRESSKEVCVPVSSAAPYATQLYGGQHDEGKGEVEADMQGAMWLRRFLTPRSTMSLHISRAELQRRLHACPTALPILSKTSLTLSADMHLEVASKPVPVSGKCRHTEAVGSCLWWATLQLPLYGPVVAALLAGRSAVGQVATLRATERDECEEGAHIYPHHVLVTGVRCTPVPQRCRYSAKAA